MQLSYDVARMQHDMASKGWQPIDLAAKARVNKATVSRFFDGSFQTPRTAAKLARALGYSVRRYLRPLEASA
jgi:plasmid maintenance system antidote protein VapI